VEYRTERSEGGYAAKAGCAQPARPDAATGFTAKETSPSRGDK
jgi:hypothetical protein